MSVQDHVGERFGQLTVWGPGSIYVSPRGKKQTRWRMLCDCGEMVDVLLGNLRAGRTTTCGCGRTGPLHKYRKCEVEGCGQPHYGHGYCSLHYSRVRAVAPLEGRPRRPRGTCTLDGCERPHAARGLCKAHYKKAWKKHQQLKTTTKEQS